MSPCAAQKETVASERYVNAFTTKLQNATRAARWCHHKKRDEQALAAKMRPGARLLVATDVEVRRQTTSHVR